MKREVYIMSAVRTAIGSFGGSLTSVSATKLGAAVIKGAVTKIKLDPKEVQEVLMGCVLEGNLGQAPARQAAIFAGLPSSVICTTVNKVCASGLKAIIKGTQSILLGDTAVVIAGGMENVSSVPSYVPSMRWGNNYGNAAVIAGLKKNRLTDVTRTLPLGLAA